MIAALATLRRWHNALFARLAGPGEAALPLVARFVFAAVLLSYFLASAATKFGDGLFGFVNPADAAYYQIVLPAVEAAGGDVSAVPFFPWGLIVRLGTWAETLLPLMLVAGLLTRLAALGMLGFIAVQTAVDISVHQVDASTIGAWFDRFPDAVIADQRLLWVLPLLVLAVKGAGTLSLDRLFAGRKA